MQSQYLYDLTVAANRQNDAAARKEPTPRHDFEQAWVRGLLNSAFVLALILGVAAVVLGGPR